MSEATLKRRLARSIERRDAAKARFDKAEAEMAAEIRAYCKATGLSFMRPEHARLIVQKDQQEKAA